MSFFDLTKDGTLSAHDLFKYRVKRDNTVPSRGGQKDFEPDGSWLQSKAVESFIQERTLVLAEPRVEKLKSLVQGTWEPEKKLVNVEKTGKFWAHMGFTDKRRNWLYPEEALFLMEINSLEVYQSGIPLSIQEAYGKFLGSGGGVRLEDYQVFAHLRRLGFVVLRHEEQPILTSYEKQINLDKYISKKSLKERKSKFLKKKIGNKKETDKSQDRGNTPASNGDSISKDNMVTDKDKASENGRIPATDAETGVNTSNSQSEDSSVQSNNVNCDGSSLNLLGKRLRSKDEDSVPCGDSGKKPHMGSCNDECQTASETMRFYRNEWSHCFRESSRLHTREAENLPGDERQSLWKDISLPNISGKETLTLCCPGEKLLPLNVAPQESIFDVEEYRTQHPPEALSRQAQREEDRDSRVRALQFSFAEWTQQKPQVSASSWAEYKAKVAHRMQEMAAATPVTHLWQGEIVPLVSPKDASSFKSVLEKLSIIQTVENEDLKPKSSSATESSKLKIAYDVHLPDHRFRKSMPGRPDHRVLVASHTDHPPGLCELQELWHLYKDDVPLHWAVVDSGDIAFYVFNNLNSIESLL